MTKWPGKIVRFYVEGFKNMTWGKTVWLVILLKLFIIFFIMKLFFFPNLLQKQFKNDEQRGAYVLEKLTNTN